MALPNTCDSQLPILCIQPLYGGQPLSHAGPIVFEGCTGYNVQYRVMTLQLCFLTDPNQSTSDTTSPMLAQVQSFTSSHSTSNGFLLELHIISQYKQWIFIGTLFPVILCFTSYKSHTKKMIEQRIANGKLMMITLTCVHTHEIQQPYVPSKQVFQPWLPVAGPPLTPTPKQCSLVEPPQRHCNRYVYCSCDLLTLPRLDPVRRSSPLHFVGGPRNSSRL